MSVLSSLGRGFGTLLLTVFLSLLILVMSFAQLTNYNTLKPLATNVLEQQFSTYIDSEQLKILHNTLVNTCKISKKDVLEYQITKKENVTLKCSEIISIEPSKLISTISNQTFDKIYYKQYDCSFVQCFQQVEREELLTLFVSLTANKFFNELIFYLYVVVAISITLIIVSVRTWYKILRTVGIIFIVVGLPYFIAPFLLSGQLFEITIPTFAAPFVEKILNPLLANYLLIFEIGIILTVIGFAGEFLLKRFIR